MGRAMRDSGSSEVSGHNLSSGRRVGNSIFISNGGDISDFYRERENRFFLFMLFEDFMFYVFPYLIDGCAALGRWCMYKFRSRKAIAESEDEEEEEEWEEQAQEEAVEGTAAHTAVRDM